ncbi:hypothetical protein CC80DRAFT_534173 [Byssothecium circinans]|uniref:Uncharacterized protein n=1 Tax=Byssothecium circinans TaxID=147558 RepID=A0A6A5UBE4_9PLEO|nr:hypothetical protein CC80DRAFT_534173 [Byssothecium circinans]
MKIPLIFNAKAGARDKGPPTTKNLLPAAERKSDKADAPSVRRRSFYEAWVQDWWLFELGSLAVGTGAFIALIILLSRYQNKVVPEMSSIAGVGITLNTMVSILATVGRACMLLPVAECISQQKNLGSMGALLLILGLAVDPLSQQLLHYEKRLEPANSVAKIGKLHFDVQSLSKSSVAVCVRWADVSSKLQRSVVPAAGSQEGQVATWSLDNRTLIGAFKYQSVFLNLSNAAELVTRPYGVQYHIEFPGTSAFDDRPSPLADFFVTYRNGSTSDKYLGSNFSAIEFMLEWCVQEYKTEVKNGVPTTTKLNATNDFRLYAEMSNDVGYRGIPSSEYSLPDYLRRTFNGSIFMKIDLLGIGKTSDAAEAFHSRLKTKPSEFDATGPEDTDVRTAMVQIVQNVATSMTNAMRQQGRLSAYGTVWEEQTFVKVQLGWIAAPMMLAGFSVLFVVATIIQSSGQARRGMVWKSSSVPTLLALNPDLHEAVGGPSSLSKTERVLRGAKVSLSQDKQEEWRLNGS